MNPKLKVLIFFLILEIKQEEFSSDSFGLKQKTITRFETSLPNEILFEIFKYLSQSDLFYAFLNLNRRFNQVLQPFTRRIDCSKISIEQFEHNRNHLENARSLVINNQVRIIFKDRQKTSTDQSAAFRMTEMT